MLLTESFINLMPLFFRKLLHISVCFFALATLLQLHDMFKIDAVHGKPMIILNGSPVWFLFPECHFLIVRFLFQDRLSGFAVL